jgi:hypothetical protein
MIVPLNVAVPPLAMASSGEPNAILPEKVLLVTVSVLLFRMPPPLPVALASATVRFATFSVAPESTANTLKLEAPSMVMPSEVVGPVIVKLPGEVFAIPGRRLFSRIVPVRLNWMVLEASVVLVSTDTGTVRHSDGITQAATAVALAGPWRGCRNWEILRVHSTVRQNLNVACIAIDC